MERSVYREMAELDQRHWWYRARRDVLADLIRRYAEPPADARILEIGCGTGHNLEMLKMFGDVDGLELDEEARTIASLRSRGVVVKVLRHGANHLADVEV
jgi:SAM-dependent methyltransferase